MKWVLGAAIMLMLVCAGAAAWMWYDASSARNDASMLAEKLRLATDDLRLVQQREKKSADDLAMLTRDLRQAQEEKDALLRKLENAAAPGTMPNPVASAARGSSPEQAQPPRSSSWDRMMATPEGRKVMRDQQRRYTAEQVSWIAKYGQWTEEERAAVIEAELDRNEAMQDFHRARSEKGDTGPVDMTQVMQDYQAKLKQILGDDRLAQLEGFRRSQFVDMRGLTYSLASEGVPMSVEQFDAVNAALLRIAQAEREVSSSPGNATRTPQQREDALLAEIKPQLSEQQYALFENRLLESRRQQEAWAALHKAAEANQTAGN